MGRFAWVVTMSLAACAHAPGAWTGLQPCKAAGGAACHRAGWGALGAEGDPVDEHAAAAFFMTGCESGDLGSCADLASLYAVGRGVPRDDGAACELGLADACARTGAPAPARSLTPTRALPPVPAALVPLESEPASEFLVAARARVWETEWLDSLGLTPQALAEIPQAPAGERALFDVLLSPRLREVEACVPRRVPADRPAGSTYSVPSHGWLAFVVSTDGRAEHPVVRLAPLPGAAAGEAERCVLAVVDRWRMPLPPRRERVWLSMVGAGPERVDESLRMPPPGEPLFATGGFTKPRMLGSVAASIRLPSEIEPWLSGHSYLVTVKFAISSSGQPIRFEVLTRDVPDAMAKAILEAVESCRWEPGRDPEGRAVSVWVILPLRFVGEAFPPARIH